MSVHIPGSLLTSPTTSYDVTLGNHATNFSAANAQLAGIEQGMAEAATADRIMYEGCVARTAEAAAIAKNAHANANTRMLHATSIADTSNYRTLFSPSSAYGPAGPFGATAPITTPYVQGYLHQR
eukprot:TRINITY_DN12490_c0_g1_i1.p1 TRINITY_DN12490_c0_g1~~TRINITY_DN12490_c0_g1_i1.p1  ORF type:complete len:125 (+),score=43.99 TRINITY_DN12490_c0_g1_i1:78-452(+)